MNNHVHEVGETIENNLNDGHYEVVNTEIFELSRREVYVRCREQCRKVDIVVIPTVVGLI